MAAAALITGASGLLGSHVLEQWDLADLRPVPWRRSDGDLLTPGVPTEMIRRLRPAVVVHLAWTASATPKYRSSVDQSQWVAATLELEQACRENRIRFVGTGSVVDAASTPLDAYSEAKANLRDRLSSAILAEEITWLRPFYVVDAVMKRPALVADALRARRLEQVLQLRSPMTHHDFVHASDVGAAVIVALRHDLRGIVPIGSGVARAVYELVEALGVAWVAPKDPDGAADHYDEVADTGRLRACGWSPRFTERLFRRE